MRNSRVSIFLPSLRGGGAEWVMATLANSIASRGVRVDLVLASAEGPYMSMIGENVRIFDLKAKRVSKSIFRLSKYLKRERPDVMLSALSHANVVSIVAKKLANVSTRIVISERSTASIQTIADKSLRSGILLKLIRLIYPIADEVIAVSAGVADDLSSVTSMPRAKIHVVYNPIDIEFLRKQSLEPVNHPWFGSNSLPVILSVGRLTEAKNYSLLLHAFAKLCALKPCRLIVLGEGELRHSLQALASKLGVENDVDFHGFVENPYAWMHRADLFVLSSAWEGLPNVLIQAMACGVPVVSTDCRSGPDEILEGGRWGKLVPVNNPEALAIAMKETLDQKKPTEFSKRANDFNVDHITDCYLSVLFK